jgi:hypothetical protein
MVSLSNDVRHPASKRRQQEITRSGDNHSPELLNSCDRFSAVVQSPRLSLETSTNPESQVPRPDPQTAMFLDLGRRDAIDAPCNHRVVVGERL